MRSWMDDMTGAVEGGGRKGGRGGRARRLGGGGWVRNWEMSCRKMVKLEQKIFCGGGGGP